MTHDIKTSWLGPVYVIFSSTVFFIYFFTFMYVLSSANATPSTRLSVDVIGSPKGIEPKQFKGKASI